MSSGPLSPYVTTVGERYATHLLAKEAVAAEVGRANLGTRVVHAVIPVDLGSAVVIRVDELVRHDVVHVAL